MTLPEYVKPYLAEEGEIMEITGTIYGVVNHIQEQKEDAKEKGITIVLVSGLSGAGKSTITDELLRRDKRFGKIKTCTSRGRRPEETKGDTEEEIQQNDPYVRVSIEDIKRLEECGDVIEHVEYSGKHYCTLRSLFEKAFADYELPLLIVDPKGSNNYSQMWKDKKHFFDKASLIHIFVVPSSLEELQNRIADRPERINEVPTDLPFVRDTQYVVVNEDGKLEMVVDDVMKYVLN